MKVSIIKAFGSSDTAGLGVQFDTLSDLSRQVTWNVNTTYKSMGVQFLRGNDVLGVTGFQSESSGYRLSAYQSFIGTASETASDSVVSLLGSGTTLVQGVMHPTADGNGAYGFNGGQVVFVNFTASPPTISAQSIGSYLPPVLPYVPGTMSFKDGTQRFVTVDAQALTMTLSTPLGSGAAMSTALSMPFTIPDISDPDGLSPDVIGAVIIGRLAKQAELIGLGTATVFDAWYVPGDGTVATVDSGQCTPPDESGSQSLGLVIANFIGPSSIFEVQIQPDYSFVISYSGSVSRPAGWTLPAYRVELEPTIIDEPFWTSFVRSFEETDAA